MHPLSTSAARRGRQGIGAWLALALMIGTLLAPMLLPDLAVARSGDKHCVGELAQGSHKVETVECYRTFAKAMAASKGGHDRVGAERSSQSVLGIFYDAPNYSTSAGSFILLGAVPVGCTTGN